MACCADGELLVQAAVDVAEGYLEIVERGGQGHARILVDAPERIVTCVGLRAGS